MNSDKNAYTTPHSRAYWIGTSRICGAVRHGFWMRKLQVVESRICRGRGGFGLGVKGFVRPMEMVSGVDSRFGSWRPLVLRRRFVLPFRSKRPTLQGMSVHCELLAEDTCQI